MALFREIEEALRNDFKAGVREVAGGHHIVFLDPDDYKADDSGHIVHVDEDYDGNKVTQAVERLREDMERELPGYTVDSTDAEMKMALEKLLNSGPFALADEYKGEDICIINEPLDIIDPEEGGANLLVMRLPGQPTDILATSPYEGDGDDLARFIGIHEGTHCGGLLTTEGTGERYVLEKEVQADYAGLQDLMSRGDHELAQQIHDWRALNAHNDPTHATSVLIDGETPQTPTQAHVDAARDYYDNMIEAAAGELGISPDVARSMLENGTSRGSIVIDAVDRLLEEGHFDSSPIRKEYTADYAGAYRRQILDKEPESEAAPPSSRPDEFPQHAGAAPLQAPAMDTAATARANEGMGTPEVAGNVALAAAAAAQTGIAPATVEGMAAQEPVAPAADTAAKPVPLNPAA